MKQFTLVLILLFTVSCNTGSDRSESQSVQQSTDLEEQILGKWLSQEGDFVEFNADGTFESSMIEYGRTGFRGISGNYFISGDLIGVNGNNAPAMTWKFSIQGDNLIVTYVQGGDLKLDDSMAKYRRPKSDR